MKVIKVPSPMRLLCGGAIAYWLAHIINPAFVAIAVMIVLFIPLFMADNLFFDQSDMIHQTGASDHQPIQKPVAKPLKSKSKPSSTQLLRMELEDQSKEKEKDNDNHLKKAKLTR